MCTLPDSAHIEPQAQIVYGCMTVDIEEIARNIRRHAYQRLGAGSGRNVYDIGDGYVAKVARNRKGLAQNEAEYQISVSDDSGLFANIVAATPNLRITIMEKAEPLRHFTAVLRYYHARSKRELYHIPLMQSAMAMHSLIFPDLCRKENWGVVNGRPVIIDYGFTMSVNRRYYFR